MAPRSIWNGTITFGLVNVPIKLYTAVESKTVHFREVHAKDGAQIEHRRICPKEDREVDYDDVVKGYEVSPDRYVVLEKDEIKAAAGDRGKVVHLTEFVDAAEIDPVFYDRTYYVGSRDAQDAYRLLHEALRRSGCAGIGRFTFHDREYLLQAAKAGSDVSGAKLHGRGRLELRAVRARDLQVLDLVKRRRQARRSTWSRRRSPSTTTSAGRESGLTMPRLERIDQLRARTYVQLRAPRSPDEKDKVR